jgi:hypothetical protein
MRFFVIGFIGCLLVGLSYILFFSEKDVAKNSDGSEGHAVLRENVTTGESSDPISRETIGKADEFIPHWRDVPFLAAEFQRIFVENFVTNGGEEESVKHVLAKTDELRDAGNFGKVPDAISKMKNNGMAVSNEADRLFQDVLYAEHFHIAGLLNIQIENWREWESKRLTNDYHFPHDRIRELPLGYSPEMHLSNMIGERKGHSFPSEFLEEAAAIRDLHVRESGAIELERYIMLASIQRTIRDVEVEVLPREWDEAVSELLPAYESVLEAAQDIEERYLGSLRMLLLENGYEVKNF